MCFGWRAGSCVHRRDALPVDADGDTSFQPFTDKSHANIETTARVQFSKASGHRVEEEAHADAIRVTQHAATEPAFRNELWNNHKPGLYVDIVSGEPLFSSLDKFDSGCGWPSFSRPLATKVIESGTTLSAWNAPRCGPVSRTRTSATCSTTVPAHALRYCINSASLRFIPLEEMEGLVTAPIGTVHQSRPLPAEGCVLSRRQILLQNSKRRLYPHRGVPDALPVAFALTTTSRLPRLPVPWPSKSNEA